MLRDFFRLIHVARTLARHDALIPREFLDALPASAKFVRFVLGIGPRKTKTCAGPAGLARALESLGPAHIKLGQVMATRPDLVGDDIALALARIAGPPAAVPDGGCQGRGGTGSRQAARGDVLVFRRTRRRRVHRAGAQVRDRGRSAAPGRREGAQTGDRAGVRARSLRARARRAHRRARPRGGAAAAPHRGDRGDRGFGGARARPAHGRRGRVGSSPNAPRPIPISACRRSTGTAPRGAC